MNLEYVLIDTGRKYVISIYLYTVTMDLPSQKTPADINIQRVCEVLCEDCEALFNIFHLICVFNCSLEEVYKPGQRILVHGVDVGQVSWSKQTRYDIQ
jgi:hypothetical protein